MFFAKFPSRAAGGMNVEKKKKKRQIMKNNRCDIRNSTEIVGQTSRTGVSQRDDGWEILNTRIIESRERWKNSPIFARNNSLSLTSRLRQWRITPSYGYNTLIKFSFDTRTRVRALARKFPHPAARKAAKGARREDSVFAAAESRAGLKNKKKKIESWRARRGHGSCERTLSRKDRPLTGRE